MNTSTYTILLLKLVWKYVQIFCNEIWIIGTSRYYALLGFQQVQTKHVHIDKSIRSGRVGEMVKRIEAAAKSSCFGNKYTVNGYSYINKTYNTHTAKTERVDNKLSDEPLKSELTTINSHKCFKRHHRIPYIEKHCFVYNKIPHVDAYVFVPGYVYVNCASFLERRIPRNVDKNVIEQNMFVHNNRTTKNVYDYFNEKELKSVCNDKLLSYMNRRISYKKNKSLLRPGFVKHLAKHINETKNISKMKKQSSIALNLAERQAMFGKVKFLAQKFNYQSITGR